MTSSFVVRGGAIAAIRNAKYRRAGYTIVAAILLILCFFPRPYSARAKVLPQDSSSAGLGQILNSLGGQFSSFASLLSNGRPPNDLYLIIGRSEIVTSDTIKSLKLVGPNSRYDSISEAARDLKEKVDIHLLLGGVLEVEANTHDSGEALQLTTAYVKSISNRIGELGRETIARKSEIVQGRFKESIIRVAQSEDALAKFRRRNNLASPEIQLGSELSQRANLQARLDAKIVELATLQRLAGPDNPQLKNVEAEIGALRQQLARGAEAQITPTGPNAAALSALSNQYFDLFRDYKFAQALYDVYARALEQVNVESLVAESATFIQIVEPPNVDVERHYNVSAVALLVGLLVVALFTELYVPATGLQWSGGVTGIDDDGE